MTIKKYKINDHFKIFYLRPGEMLYVNPNCIKRNGTKVLPFLDYIQNVFILQFNTAST